MNGFPLCDPNIWIAHQLRVEVLHILQHGMIVQGVVEGIGWRLAPTVADQYSDVEVNLLKKGRWIFMGTFMIHEYTIDTIVEYLDIEINKALEDKS